jgi:hypothetical protein
LRFCSSLLLFLFCCLLLLFLLCRSCWLHPRLDSAAFHWLDLRFWESPRR